jgi:hypothetical protein
MLLCAFLGLPEDNLITPPPYVRILAFNDRGRDILNLAKQTSNLVNIGQRQDHPYQELEDRCSDLFGLFAEASPEGAGKESKRRVYYHK